jgi:hypothetical protein
MRVRFGVVALALGVAACAGSKDPAYRSRPGSGSGYTLAATYVLPAGEPIAKQFNGVSGLAPLRDGHEMLAILDDREQSRVYRIAMDWTAAGLNVTPLAAIPLQGGEGAPAGLDPEVIAISRDGHMLISSEGVGNVEPRIPPALIEYGVDGRFIRQLPVRSRFLPNGTGPQTTGVRQNAGFESLAISPDFTRLFTATELPIVQDGTDDPFARGVHTRLLEYVADGRSYKPAREFAYELTPLETLTFTPRFTINGVVELLAVDGGDLLVLERGFAESIDRTLSMNRIRIFRISLDGATDVSGIDSLAGASFKAVRKTLVLDVNRVPGLTPRLEHLDNFEGMAWGPAASPGGERSLVIVSDDNQNPRQVTAFLLFEHRMKR